MSKIKGIKNKMGIEEKLFESNLRVIGIEKMKGSEIAAITQYLHENAKKPTLAFFQWTPSISLSCYQSIDDVNLNLAKEKNYQIVRMIGGGRAYIHNSDVSFLFILPNYSKPFSNEENYSFAASKFIEAFNFFGLKSELKNPQENGFDVYCNNKILLGLAQDSTKKSLMIHGAFYYQMPDYESALNLIKGYSKDDLELLKKNVGYFKENSNAKLSEVVQKIIGSFSKNYYFEGLSKEEREKIILLEKIYESKSHINGDHLGKTQNRGLCWLPKEPYPLPKTFKN